MIPVTDHFCIHMNLTYTSNHSTTIPPRWHFDRSDWSSFTGLSRDSSTRPDDLYNLDEALSNFNNIVQTAAKSSKPRTSQPTHIVKQVP